MNRFRTVFFATVAAIIFLAGEAGGTGLEKQAEDPRAVVSGFWYTEGRDGVVEIYPCGDEICGRLQWIEDEGNHSHDTRNPDPDLRQRPLCHLQFMGGFTPDGKDHFADGWIYSPRNGGTYSAEMTLVDHETLDLHGYLFVPMLGESQVWKRAKKMNSCANGR